MGRAKNSLTRESVSSVPVKLRYSVTYDSSSLSNYGINAITGSNIAYTADMSAADMEEMNRYRVARQLYYQQAISASIGSSSFWDPAWQSTAASGTQDATYHNFPTEPLGTVIIFAIPSSQFGENIGRKSFALSSSAYYIADDGNGNMIDYKNSNTHVGNIFYAQGVAVITNLNYSTDTNNYLDTQNYFDIQTQNNDDILI